MEDKEFCLLDESWIWVNTADLKKKPVSLIEVMIHAQDYINLAGETPTQDAAIFRLLLAIALTVFYRYDENNLKKELSEKGDCDARDVLERWKAYWDRGSFPEEAIKTYLETYRERFYLFHPQTPFYQINGMYEKKYGTEYSAKCLVGNIKESMHTKTKHHFSMAEGNEIDKLSYGEAARWLIHLNAYGVNVKPPRNVPRKTNEPVGVGRLGQLGLVMIRGDNLFQTLMLNLCALKNQTDLWKMPNPAWEREVCMEREKKIAPPDNLPELYTIQSRKIMLKREEPKIVTGFRAIGGEFYPVKDDFNEPMTLWKREKPKSPTMIPKLYDSSVYVWKEFPCLLNEAEFEERIPGIVVWLKQLYEQKVLLPRKLIQFQMIGMMYGDQNRTSYGDCINNSLDVSEGMLTDFAKEWIGRITEEVNSCKKVGDVAIKPFAERLNKIYYASEKDVKKSNLKNVLIQNYYFLIDNAFRSWLASINPMQEEKEEKLAEWRKTSYQCAKRIVEEYLVGHKPKLYAYKENGKEILTVPKAVNQFIIDLRKIYPQTESQGKERT